MARTQDEDIVVLCRGRGRSQGRRGPAIFCAGLVTRDTSLAAMGTDREILAEIAAGDPLPHLQDPRPEVRRLAVSACSGVHTPRVESALADLAADDEDEEVRAQAVEILGEFGPNVLGAIQRASSDSSVRVVEAAVTALGELGSPQVVPWLIETATVHDEAIVREAAVAALGAIGDKRALPTLLETVANGKPQVRRRSVVALSAFDGPEVEAALAMARLDRNPMVREVAEMLLGRLAPQ